MNLAYFLLFAVSVALFLAGLPLLTTCLQNLAGSQLDRFLVQTIGHCSPGLFRRFTGHRRGSQLLRRHRFLHWPGGQRAS